MPSIRPFHHTLAVWACSVLCLTVLPSSGAAPALGVFTDQTDVGKVGKAGSVELDAARGSYLIAGGGENMWATNDAFHYVWKRFSGDVALAADIRWIGTNGNAHRKACLVFRQTLEADSVYVDAAVHGSGLTSIQYRETTSGPTREVQSNVSAPGRVRLEKRGDYVSLSVAATGEDLKTAGGSFRVVLKETFYVGLALCAHDNNALEQAVFSNVVISALPSTTNLTPTIESTLEVITIASTDRRVVYHTRDRIEAPNWSRDGQFFIFNRGGHLYRISVAGGEPRLLDTGSAIRCNNDHGLSPDGTQLAISDQTQDSRSRIYVVPIAGGEPRCVTPLGPSYWHGWSPDGQTLVYCGQRNGEFDIYTMPVGGGEERHLTSAPGLDDGPEYSPDGKWIYFSSERSGSMQVWRMHPDGSGQEPVTADGYNNWFAHPSPDGRWLVFLSYAKEVKDHPANQDVMLRLVRTSGGEPQVIAKLFGGQGTINAPSWSPDSRQVAFVSYQRVYP